MLHPKRIRREANLFSDGIHTICRIKGLTTERTEHTDKYSAQPVTAEPSAKTEGAARLLSPAQNIAPPGDQR